MAPRSSALFRIQPRDQAIDLPHMVLEMLHQEPGRLGGTQSSDEWMSERGTREIVAFHERAPALITHGKIAASIEPGNPRARDDGS